MANLHSETAGTGDGGEILHRSYRSLVFRFRTSAGISAIGKRPLGPGAGKRLSHERGILARLSAVSGVSKLLDEPLSDALALEDDEAESFHSTRNRLSPAALVETAIALSRILDAVHQAGIIHQAINPSHLLWSRKKGRLLLIDFSEATSFAEERPAFSHPDHIPGNLTYIAPEQTGRTGWSVDHRADLYSLGITLYELAAGHPPFIHSDPLQLIHDQLAKVPPLLTDLDPAIPRPLSEIIMRLIEKEPDCRYQGARGLLSDLVLLQGSLERGEPHPFELGSRDFPSRLLAPSRIIGRKAEVEILRNAFENALKDQCRAVVVSGAPGTGKTTLANELRPLVTACRGRFVSGKFDQFRQDPAGNAVQQVFHALGTLLLAEPEEDLAPLRSRILIALGPDLDLVTCLVPEFALLLRHAAGNAIDEEQLQSTSHLVRIGVEMLRAIVSPQRPLVIVLDDLQWAAPTPLAFLDALFLEPDLPGLLVVAAYREGEVDAVHPLTAMQAQWERFHVRREQIKLRNLPPADVTLLLGEMLRLPHGGAAHLARAIETRTQGNPYDTVELVNALRREDILHLGTDGWEWDSRAIRQYVGKGEVLEILRSRIQKLPREAVGAIESLGALGGELDLRTLGLVCQMTDEEIEECLKPALEEGLVIIERGGNRAIRFRHDRVQQAAYDGIDLARRPLLHLGLARRLAHAGVETLAAEQYCRSIEEIETEEERRAAIRLMETAAAAARLTTNFIAAERYLSVALRLAKATHLPVSELIALKTGSHSALYNLGRLEEADQVFVSIEELCADDRLRMFEATLTQLISLSYRERCEEALKIGLEMLGLLGIEFPRDNLQRDIGERVDALAQWANTLEIDEKVEHRETCSEQVRDAGKLFKAMQSAAFFCNPLIHAWLALESHRLWKESGACNHLMLSYSAAPMLLAGLREDYRASYAISRYLVAFGDSVGYRETAHARFVFSSSIQHWFEPLENCLTQALTAGDQFLRNGDLQFACFSYHPRTTVRLENGTLASWDEEMEAAISFAMRTRNDRAWASFNAQQLLSNALHGTGDHTNNFLNSEFDTEGYLRQLGPNPMAVAYFHIHRAIAALLFGELEVMERHAAAVLPLLNFIQGFYSAAQVRWLHALGLATNPNKPAAAAAQLNQHHAWLRARAADSPDNFLHWALHLEAEIAWAAHDFASATRAFDAALAHLGTIQRPWHRALITERTARFYLAQSLEHAGRKWMTEAHRLYHEWGAEEVVRRLEKEHPFLAAGEAKETARSTALSSDSVDLRAILRASQTLSSEIGVDRLNRRVGELLGAMTGATKVLLILRDADSEEWQVRGEGSDAALSVEEAARRKLLPLSAFHYAKRTRVPLLVEDAVADDRFSRDSYFAGKERCSLLLVPLLSQGTPHAILLLENSLSRGAFSSDRLDAVLLIAGQLTVSIHNAVLYASLEHKVDVRTQELARSISLLNATIDSTADGILALESSGRVVCYNQKFADMWNIPTGALEENGGIIRLVAEQLKQPDRFVSRVNALCELADTEVMEVVEARDDRTFECYIQPQSIDGRGVGIVVNFRDITGRIKAEKDLIAAHRLLVETSHKAGMAEVATSILHNVGNVLNSVNVASMVITHTLEKMKTDSFVRTTELIGSQSSLGKFLEEDPQGKQVPGYLGKLADHFSSSKEQALRELTQLRENIDHIKVIVAMQQDYAKVVCATEQLDLVDLVEDALRMNFSDSRDDIEIAREYRSSPKVTVQKHKILQILVNLLRNARHACNDSGNDGKRITVRLTSEAELTQLEVADNGIGIAEENLPRIFSQGFTTRKEGHGFGLHSAALAAREMGGTLSVRSGGPGLGATFTLSLPTNPPPPWR